MAEALPLKRKKLLPEGSLTPTLSQREIQGVRYATFTIMAQNKGFTLLEMILVLVVAGLMTAIAVPNLQPMLSRMQLQSSARDIASGLRHSRGQALMTGKEQVFMLDVERHFYQISGRHKPYVLPKSLHLELFTAEQYVLNEAQGSIRFFPDGTSSGGRISLDVLGIKRWVDVNWLTGVVMIRESNL